MLRRKFLGVIGLAATMLFAGTAAAEDAKKTLNFGIISTESSQNLKKVWLPFLADMEKKTGFEVKPFFAPDYAGVIEAMRYDKVDIAWFGNKSAMVAVDRSGGEIFAQTVDVTGNPGYWSLLVAHKDSKLNSVEDILANAKDLSFGNGDPNSTSGFLVPSYYVWTKNNVDPKRIFKRVLNSNHQTNLLAVANKQIDFATNNTENWSRLEKTHPEKLKNLKVLWKSPLIPSDPIVWRVKLDDETKSTIKSFIMDYGVKGDDVAAEKEKLAALDWAPFRDSSNDQLLPIRQLSLFKDRNKVAKDEKISAEEKAAKLKEIDAQLDSLNQKMAAISKKAS
jgi:phosphonate transport system substrate-binding protein